MFYMSTDVTHYSLIVWTVFFFGSWEKTKKSYGILWYLSMCDWSTKKISILMTLDSTQWPLWRLKNIALMLT